MFGFGTIRPDVRFRLALEQHKENLANQARNRRMRKFARGKPRKDAKHIAKMTNWQRNQYARAGYPVARAAEFTRLVK